MIKKTLICFSMLCLSASVLANTCIENNQSQWDRHFEHSPPTEVKAYWDAICEEEPLRPRILVRDVNDQHIHQHITITNAGLPVKLRNVRLNKGNCPIPEDVVNRNKQRLLETGDVARIYYQCDRIVTIDIETNLGNISIQ